MVFGRCDPDEPDDSSREREPMNATAAKARYTPDDLTARPDGGKGYELVDGFFVEKQMGTLSSWVPGRILRILASLEDQGLGWALPPDTGFQCFSSDRDRVRKPEVSFIRRGRLPDDRLPSGYCPIAPDLAVEVLSPKDRVYDIESRVQDYLTAGVPLVWLVNPETRTVQVIHPDGTSVRLEEADELTGGDALPEFRCRVADFFTLPERQ
jgi:Uma2 family endonuclease